jgi:hypothetical protein
MSAIKRSAGRVQFALREQPVVKLPYGERALQGEPSWLPPARVGYQPVEPLMGSAKTAPNPPPSLRCTA